MAATQRAPPPSLEQLSRLQLMRTTLVNFIEWKNFSDVVNGCYVRVLLEMRSEDRQRDTVDNYYIACVRGARKGPAYSGFSCDGATTEWHILIELPPCFRASANGNGNIVQLNSISNSPFKPNEYQNWIQNTRESNQPFITIAQLEFRFKCLEEHKQQAMTPAVRKRKAGEDPEAMEQRERKMTMLRDEVRQEIQETFAFFPHSDKLRHASLEELQEVERECLDIISKIRLALNEKSKCLLCRNHVSTVVCYPCKHQVVCKTCMDKTGSVCPAPGCGANVSQKFEAFSA